MNLLHYRNKADLKKIFKFGFTMMKSQKYARNCSFHAKTVKVGIKDICNAKKILLSRLICMFAFNWKKIFVLIFECLVFCEHFHIQLYKTVPCIYWATVTHSGWSWHSVNMTGRQCWRSLSQTMLISAVARLVSWLERRCIIRSPCLVKKQIYCICQTRYRNSEDF